MLARRLALFGAVGVAATLTHLSVAEAALWLGADPRLASLAGFLPAFAVSWQGHRRATFAGLAPRPGAVFRFLAIAVAGFLASLAVLSGLGGLPPALALGVSVAVIPAATYLLTRFLVFRDG